MTTNGFSRRRVLLQTNHGCVPRFLRFPFSYGEKGSRVTDCAVETCPSRTRHTLNNRACTLPGFYVFLDSSAFFDSNEKNVLQFSFPALDSALNCFND